MSEEKTVFETLLEYNVNELKEKKGKFDYLPWADAWAEINKAYPNKVSYTINKFSNKDGCILPYMKDTTGYMVSTSVTIEDVTHEMWLPVMNFANKAMKEDATMFEINKSIMRCLTKNLAMFGLGLYIFRGEDLPEEEKKDNFANQEQVAKAPPPKKKVEKTLEERVAKLTDFILDGNTTKEAFMKHQRSMVVLLDELTKDDKHAEVFNTLNTIYQDAVARHRG